MQKTSLFLVILFALTQFATGQNYHVLIGTIGLFTSTLTVASAPVAKSGVSTGFSAQAIMLYIRISSSGLRALHFNSAKSMNILVAMTRPSPCSYSSMHGMLFLVLESKISASSGHPVKYPSTKRLTTRDPLLR